MKSLQFRQDGVVRFFEEAYREDADRVMAEAAVVDLVREKEISAVKGADILGMHLTEFVDLMARRGVAYFSEPLQDPDIMLARYQRPQE
jgi:predicted HTH domain antitoxin